ARPFVATNRPARLALWTREPMTLQHLPDRRVRAARRDGQQPRTPAGAAPGRTDTTLLGSRQQPRHPPRPARAIEQTGKRPALLLIGLAPAAAPAADGRLRDAEPPRHLPHRQPPLTRLHQRETARQSELGVTVKLHPGPSSRSESWQTHSLEGGPRSEEHTSELQSPVVISYAVFCLKK